MRLSVTRAAVIWTMILSGTAVATACERSAARAASQAPSAAPTVAAAAQVPNPAPSAGVVTQPPSAALTVAAAALMPVAPYLQEIFASLDTVLTTAQRDSLRAMSLDSAYVFRAQRLAAIVKPMEPAWLRTPIGDSVNAREEHTFMTAAIVLDLYQQHLGGGDSVDLDAAFRRISPNVVLKALGEKDVISVDSIALREDVDGSGTVDHLVREVQRNFSASLDYPTDPGMLLMRRMALYLDGPPGASRAPAWALDWDDIDDPSFSRRFSLGDDGSLLVIDIGGADGYEMRIVLARHGQVRELLKYLPTFGVSHWAIRESDGRIVLDVSGPVEVDARVVSPENIPCAQDRLPGSTLVFDRATRRFVKERSVCLRPSD